MKSFLWVLLSIVVAATLRAQTWTSARTNLPGINAVYSMAYGNGRFVATLGGTTGSAGAAWSTDAITWHASTTALAMHGGISFFNGTFYLAVGSAVWKSTDGDTWQMIFTAAGVDSWRTIATDGRGMLVSSSTPGGRTLLFSADLVKWVITPALPNTGLPNTDTLQKGVYYAAGRFYVSYWVPNYATSALNIYLVSTADGLTWRDEPGVAHPKAYNGIAWGNGLIVGYGSEIVRSTDGTNYSSTTLSSSLLNGGPLVFTGGRFLMSKSLYASSDGLFWQQIGTNPLSAAPDMLGVTYGNGRYVAYGTGSDDFAGSVRDFVVWLDAPAPPVFSAQPSAQSVVAGRSITLQVNLENNNATTTYQWWHDGVAVAGANGTSLVIVRAKSSDAGRYTCVVTNSVGTSSSTPAALTILPDDSRLFAMSCRAVVGTGGNVLIPGIVIGGSGDRQIIVRAKGPALSNVSGTLARPRLQLYKVNVTTPIAENTGWSSGTQTQTSALQTAFDQAGLPGFPLGSSDCALVATVSAGSAYTAVVSGLNETSGVALVEVYELGTASARLAALSCRAQVGSGGDILIPGIAIVGTSPKLVLVRASAPLGVSNGLTRPNLVLYNSTGAKIAENTGWSTAANAADIFAVTPSCGLVNFTANSADCAILISVPPGNYTAQVSGVGDTTGVSLVEVYEVP